MYWFKIISGIVVFGLTNNRFSYIMTRTSYIWWDNNNVHFVLDHHAYLDFYIDISLIQQSMGRHVASTWTLILCQPVFSLTP